MQQKYGFCFFMTERQHTYRSSCPNLWSCPLVPHGFVLGSFSEVVKAGHSTVPPCHYHPVTGWEKVFKFNGILLKTMQSDFYRETNACVTTDCKRRLPCCVCVGNVQLRIRVVSLCAFTGCEWVCALRSNHYQHAHKRCQCDRGILFSKNPELKPFIQSFISDLLN